MSSPQAMDAAAVPAKDDADLFPCSATQERCWFLDRLDPGNPALNVAVRWNVKGQFSASTLEGAFRAVIARHEILRTRFVEADGRPFQRIMDGADFRLSEIDIRTTPEAEQEARIEAIAVESARLPFDLTRPGLIRATLIRLSNDRAILAITVHQICFDGWSIRILGREIGEFAAALDEGREAALPDLALQYCDYALWQRAYLDSGAFEEDLEAWRGRMKGASYFELPPDYARPLERTSNCGMVMADLPVAFGERLEAEAKKRSMSPFAFGAAVLSAMLARCAGTSEVLLGTQVAGRSEVDLEPLIGVFINNVVLRFDTPEAMTFEEHLKRARTVVHEALMGQNVPFNKLVEAVSPARDPSRTPLLSVNFILQKAFLETARYGTFELSSAPSHAPGAIYDLSFILIGRATGWRMTLEYNSDLFGRSTAEALLDFWQAAFQLAFDQADRRLGEMPAPAMEGRRADAELMTRLEAALAAHPFVDEAAAVQFVDGEGARRLHAFVTPSEQAAIPLETLPDLLSGPVEEALPKEHPATAVSVLRAMPRDKNGRVARSMLPAVPTSAMSRAQPEPSAGLAEIESRLAGIWSDLLDTEAISPASNFFELGGHSLLTVRMMNRIEQEFGQRLSLATVYRAPTLRALARALGGSALKAPDVALRDQADWRVLVLQPEGDGIPLIAINNAQTVYAISEHFSRPRRALAVRIFDKSRDEPLPPCDFDAIAAAYVDAVRSAQPHGPYALFGICAHGNLAVEVARQLKQAGEEVAAVILKDVWEPRYAERIEAGRMTRLACSLHAIRRRYRFLRQGDISMTAFLGSFRILRKTGLLDLAVRMRLLDRVRFTDLDQEQEEFILYLTEARDRHHPEPYDGLVLHFITGATPMGRGFEPAMGWDRVVTGRLITRSIDRLELTPSGQHGIDRAAHEIESILSTEDPAWT